MKYKSVELIESLGYEIDVKRFGDGFVKIQLLEKGESVSEIKCRSNVESLVEINERIAGRRQIKDNTYLSVGLDHLYVDAIAHSLKNSRINTARSAELILDLSKSEKALLSEKLNQKPAVVTAPATEHFFLVHAQSQTRSGEVNFTNEFVGTERDFREYLSSYKAKIKSIEVFEPDFRDTHREIERIIRCYQHKTGDKHLILDSLKGFDNAALLRLEDRLTDNGINLDSFQNEYKQKSNKLKM